MLPVNKFKVSLNKFFKQAYSMTLSLASSPGLKNTGPGTHCMHVNIDELAHADSVYQSFFSGLGTRLTLSLE